MFEATCSQCHELSEVAAYPLGSGQDVRDLLERMVENGLEATEEEMTADQLVSDTDLCCGW